MGQFGPSVSGNQGIRRYADSGVYLIGVLVSSFIFGVLADAAGIGISGAAGERGAAAALIAASMLVGLDALRLWGGRSTSFGPARQTPYDWRLRGWRGVLGWGLDTGLPLTTVRATPLPVLGVILIVTGHAGPFHGLFYGMGLALGVVASLIGARSEPRIDKAMDKILLRHRQLGPARLVLAPGIVVVALLAAYGVLQT